MAAISCAFLNISVTNINDAKDVSLTRLINEFDNGGMDTLDACGKMIRFNACGYVIPMEYAASHCPFGVDRMAARIISEAYAPRLSENPITAAGNESMVTPMDGKP